MSNNDKTRAGRTVRRAPVFTRRLRKTRDEVVYDVVKWLFVGIFTTLVVLPLVHIAGISLAAPEVAAKGISFFWPADMSLDAYRRVVRSGNLILGLRNSFIITIGGIAAAMILSTMLAYGMSRRNMPGVRALNLLVVFCMVFHPALIPLFLIVRALGLLNTYAAVILVMAINPFLVIILRNFFENIPDEMHESAYIDGAGEGRILWSIMLPLATPALAAITLFYAVGFWNNYFQPLVFIPSMNEKWPIQVWLRQMVRTADSHLEGTAAGYGTQGHPETLKMAVVIFAMIPIAMVYPFLQKHFAKGIMLGAVKG